MVKPEFFDSESLGACSILARYCFIGLWVISDDYGNQKMQPSRMRMKVFPYDTMTDAEFVGLLGELEQVGCIKGYEVDGERYINIPNFSVYQTVRKPSATSVPEPPKATQKAKRTDIVRGWQYGTSASLVRHQYATGTDKERKKEGSNEVFTDFITNERVAADEAAAAEAAPPSAPICPLCSSPLKMMAGADGIKWKCPICGDVKEPAFGAPKAVAS